MVPADKASNNITVVCKKHYIEVMIAELTKGNVINQSTYVDVPTNKDRLKVIISKHLQYMNSRNIRVPAVMEQLPNVYWLPKLHKVPYGSRFIAASNSCTTKPLSQLLTSCLSMILTHFKEY